MIILTFLSIGLLAGGAYVLDAVATERNNRKQRKDLILRGYIL